MAVLGKALYRPGIVDLGGDALAWNDPVDGWADAQVFEDSIGGGHVVFAAGTLREISAGWFGVSAGASATDNTTGVNLAIASAIASGVRRVRLPGVGAIAVNTLTDADQVVFVSGGAYFTNLAYRVRIEDDPLIPRPKPSAFSWVPFEVTALRHDGTALVNFDVMADAPTGKRYYIAPPAAGGSNSNSGLTPSDPLATLNYAFGLGDGVEFVLMDGLYRRAWQTSGPTSDCVIRAYPGATPILSMHDLLSWTSSAPTYANVWQANRSGVTHVRDATIVDENGDYLRMVQQQSIQDVNDNPNSWYTDGSVVYVRTLDDREPGGDEIRAYLDIVGAIVEDDVTVHMEGIRFEGGRDAFRAISDGAGLVPTIYAKRCEFKYSCGASNGNDFSSFGAITYLQECLAAGGNRDGFNYHKSGADVAYSVEIDCVARDNGDPQSSEQTLNGSTSHDNGFAARFNGRYFRNQGPNVVDVLGSKSWNVGCEVGASASTLMTVQNSGFYTEDEMWLDSCRASGSSHDLVANGANAKLLVRNTAYSSAAPTLANGGSAEGW